ncbi:MAG: sensor histidine kinase [Candidatus Rokuibacteriota bacterium]|nr:MAG: sensor histidine kinase [Candidatus Rokubacteria bacterium]
MNRVRNTLWPLAKRFWFDALIIVGLGVSIAVAVSDLHHKHGGKGPLWFDVLGSILYVVPLFFRRRYPFGAPAAVFLLITAISFVDAGLVDAEGVMFIAAIASAFLFGMLKDRRKSVAGIGIMLGAVPIVSHNQGQGVGSFIFPFVVFGIAWTVGYGLDWKFREAEEARERAERAEWEREEKARLAVADERTRIARELHDIVGHSVSVMTVQAAGVRSLLRPDQERAREAVTVVEQTGREALAEMRRLVGVLRRPEEAPALAPQPSLEHLDKLVEQAREAGLPVELTVEGDPVELPAGVDLTAYRLVQEGLTNAIKHANAKHAEVLVRYDDGHVELTVSDDGTGDGGGESGGHGLVGMRERITVYGGELDAGPQPQGGYRLHATLPTS